MISQLLSELQAQGLTLELEGGNLRVKPQALLTDEIRAVIKAHKQELIADVHTLEAIGEPAPVPESVATPTTEAEAWLADLRSVIAASKRAGYDAETTTTQIRAQFPHIPATAIRALYELPLAPVELGTLSGCGGSRLDYVTAHATPEQLELVEPPASLSIAELHTFITKLLQDRQAGYSIEECLTHYLKFWPVLELQHMRLLPADEETIPTPESRIRNWFEAHPRYLSAIHDRHNAGWDSEEILADVGRYEPALTPAHVAYALTIPHSPPRSGATCFELLALSAHKAKRYSEPPPPQEEKAWDQQTAKLIEWFQADPQLPKEPFFLWPYSWVANPSKFYEALRMDIDAGPEGPRAWYGSVQKDLARIYELVTKEEMVAMFEQTRRNQLARRNKLANQNTHSLDGQTLIKFTERTTKTEIESAPNGTRNPDEDQP